MFSYYLTYVFDPAHFFELLLLAAAWSMLENRLRQKPENLLRAFAEMALLLAVLFLCDSYMTRSFRTQYMLYWVIVQGLISAAYIFIYRREYSRAGFALWCSMYAGSISIIAIGGQMSVLLSTLSVAGAWQGVIRVVFGSLNILLAIYLNERRLDECEYIPSTGLVMILAGDFCLLLIRFLESRWFSLYYYYAILLAAAYFCVLILVLCAVNAVATICREQARTLELMTEHQRTLSEHELVLLTEKRMDELQQIRHDISNQYAYMRILLSEKRYEELEEYFHRQSGTLSTVADPLDCGNRCVNIVLNMERHKAEGAGVTLNTRLVVPPLLPFPDDDLCSLLSNLIDNAIEECVRLAGSRPEVLRQGISLSINPGNPSSDYLYIEVQNPTDQKRLLRRPDGIISTKTDAHLHGYGTRIITRLAEKYNGTVMFEAADGVFTARVLLDMMYQKGEETT